MITLSHRPLTKKRFNASKKKFTSGFIAADALQVIQQYGFIECAAMINFLTMVSNNKLSRADCHWLYASIKNCLEVHDEVDSNQVAKNANYFDDLKLLAEELEFYLSVVS
ncbi:hypothetical protein KW823_10110 [Enterobacter quasiroggenkampii]|nr:hypothetical protein [Enterobacter quasiroggenkampii]